MIKDNEEAIRAASKEDLDTGPLACAISDVSEGGEHSPGLPYLCIERCDRNPSKQRMLTLATSSGRF